MNDPSDFDGDALEEQAKQAALKFAMGQEMTEEDWAVLHDFACDVLQELDMVDSYINDDE